MPPSLSFLFCNMGIRSSLIGLGAINMRTEEKELTSRTASCRGLTPCQMFSIPCSLLSNSWWNHLSKKKSDSSFSSSPQSTSFKDMVLPHAKTGQWLAHLREDLGDEITFHSLEHKAASHLCIPRALCLPCQASSSCFSNNLICFVQDKGQRVLQNGKSVYFLGCSHRSQ